MLWYQCTICLNIAKITEKEQVVCEIITPSNELRDEPSNPLSSNSEYIKYKASITGNTYNLGAGEDGYDADKVGKNKTKVAVPLKDLNNFWRTLNIPLINCEIELIWTWSKNCVLADITVRAAGNNNDPPAIVHQLY